MKDENCTRPKQVAAATMWRLSGCVRNARADRRYFGVVHLLSHRKTISSYSKPRLSAFKFKTQKGTLWKNATMLGNPVARRCHGGCSHGKKCTWTRGGVRGERAEAREKNNTYVND